MDVRKTERRGQEQSKEERCELQRQDPRPVSAFSVSSRCWSKEVKRGEMWGGGGRFLAGLWPELGYSVLRRRLESRLIRRPWLNLRRGSNRLCWRMRALGSLRREWGGRGRRGKTGRRRSGSRGGDLWRLMGERFWLLRLLRLRSGWEEQSGFYLNAVFHEERAFVVMVLYLHLWQNLIYTFCLLVKCLREKREREGGFWLWRRCVKPLALYSREKVFNIICVLNLFFFFFSQNLFTHAWLELY